MGSSAHWGPPSGSSFSPGSISTPPPVFKTAVTRDNIVRHALNNPDKGYEASTGLSYGYSDDVIAYSNRIDLERTNSLTFAGIRAHGFDNRSLQGQLIPTSGAAGRNLVDNLSLTGADAVLLGL